MKPLGGDSKRGYPPLFNAFDCLGIKKEVAEEEGFEPPVALTTLVFKTSAFNRSAIPPTEGRVYTKRLKLSTTCATTAHAFGGVVSERLKEVAC